MKKISKKGVALIWALVTSTVILIIATTMATAVIKESQMSVRIDASTQAYALAKSGIDLGNACLEEKDCPPINIGDVNPLNFTMPLIGAEEGLTGDISVSITKTPEDFIIESTGTVNNVKRKLKHHAKEEVGTVLEDPTLLPKITTKERPTGIGVSIINTESYTQKFEFWNGTGGDATVGLSDVTDVSVSNAIYMEYTVGSGFRVCVKNGATSSCSEPITVSIDPAADEYGYRAEIEVIRDYVAQLRILKKNPGDVETFTCLGATYVSLKGTNINVIDLNELYPSTGVSYGLGGDDNIVTIGGLIIDNMTLYNIARKHHK
jgi:hypothetical protein